MTASLGTGQKAPGVQEPWAPTHRSGGRGPTHSPTWLEWCGSPAQLVLPQAMKACCPGWKQEDPSRAQQGQTWPQTRPGRGLNHLTPSSFTHRVTGSSSPGWLGPTLSLSPPPHRLKDFYRQVPCFDTTSSYPVPDLSKACFLALPLVMNKCMLGLG